MMNRTVVYTAPRGLTFTRRGLTAIIEDLGELGGRLDDHLIVEVVPTGANQKVGRIKKVTQHGSL